MASQRPTDPRGGGRRAVRCGLGVVALLVMLAVPTLARADTVYLKNGRVLRAAKVTVTEDRVILEQGATRVEFPLALVERVEKDERESELLDAGPPRPARPPADEEPEEPDVEGEVDVEGEEVADDAEPETPPEETRAYWQELVRANRQTYDELQATLEELEREERAFLFSHRSTAETKRAMEQVRERMRELDEEMSELQRDARRKGIPPGWLRIDG